jgi:hypothetical protein
MNANQYPDPVIVEIPLINEYGTQYGVNVLIFAWSDEQAEKAMLAHYTEDIIYGQHGLYDQFSARFITAYDGGGNINRQWSDWFDLVKMFAGKKIGPSVLKKISRCFPD